MDLFLKYPSIDNLKKNAISTEYYDRIVVVEHKIDGRNFQIIFKKNGNTIDVYYGSRNAMVTKDNDWFKFQDTISKYSKMIENLKKYLYESTYHQINLYGELYGGNSSKINRINYFEKRPYCDDFVSFGVRIDGKWIPPRDFYSFANENGINIVEVLAITTLEDAIYFNVEDPSIVSQLVPFDTKIEGVVIKEYEWHDEPSFQSFKIKSTEFREIESFGNKVTEFSQHGQFIDYLNKNRALNCFGKQPWVKSQIPILCEEIIKDALSEYNRDNCSSLELKDVLFAKRHAFILIKDFFKH